MNWKGFFLAIFFAISMFGSFSAGVDCDSGCVSEKTKVEEHCLMCVCTRRGIEREKIFTLKSSIFLYQIPELVLLIQTEKEFVEQSLKPPNSFLFV